MPPHTHIFPKQQENNLIMQRAICFVLLLNYYHKQTKERSSYILDLIEARKKKSSFPHQNPEVMQQWYGLHAFVQPKNIKNPLSPTFFLPAVRSERREIAPVCEGSRWR